MFLQPSVAGKARFRTWSYGIYWRIAQLQTSQHRLNDLTAAQRQTSPGDNLRDGVARDGMNLQAAFGGVDSGSVAIALTLLQRQTPLVAIAEITGLSLCFGC